MVWSKCSIEPAYLESSVLVPMENLPRKDDSEGQVLDLRGMNLTDDEALGQQALKCLERFRKHVIFFQKFFHVISISQNGFTHNTNVVLASRAGSSEV